MAGRLGMAIGLGFERPKDAGKRERSEAENGRGRPVAGNDRRAAGSGFQGGVPGVLA